MLHPTAPQQCSVCLCMTVGCTRYLIAAWHALAPYPTRRQWINKHRAMPEAAAGVETDEHRPGRFVGTVSCESPGCEPKIELKHLQLSLRKLDWPEPEGACLPTLASGRLAPCHFPPVAKTCLQLHPAATAALDPWKSEAPAIGSDLAAACFFSVLQLCLCLPDLAAAQSPDEEPSQCRFLLAACEAAEHRGHGRAEPGDGGPLRAISAEANAACCLLSHAKPLRPFCLHGLDGPINRPVQIVPPECSQHHGSISSGLGSEACASLKA